MLRILLLSDTHSYVDDSILSHAANADEIWHAGDFGNMEIVEQLRKVKPLRGVWGNIDGREIRTEFPLDNRFTIEGLNVWMTHIGGYPGHYERRVRTLLTTHRPGLFICGHSHILRVMRDPKFDMLCMNPGAAGISGFHKMRTMLRFEIHNSAIGRVEAIELGLRGKIK